MLQIVDLVENPFLAGDQAQILANLGSAVSQIEFPPSGQELNSYIDNVLVKYCDVIMSGAVAIAVMSQRLPNASITDSSMLETCLQWSALRETHLSTSLKMMGHIAAISTACEVVEHGENMEAVHGYEFGNAVIRQRAKREAAALLRATTLITADFGEDKSIWAITAETYENNPRLKSPVVIDSAAADRFMTLRGKALGAANNAGTLFKSSRSKALTQWRAKRSAWRFVRQYGSQNDLEHLNETFESIQAKTSGVPDFSESEIYEAVGTTKKIRRHVINAAKANPSLATDPRVRYLTFLGEKLTSYKIGEELAIFGRNVTRYTYLQRRALGQQPTGEE